MASQAVVVADAENAPRESTTGQVIRYARYGSTAATWLTVGITFMAEGSTRMAFALARDATTDVITSVSARAERVVFGQKKLSIDRPLNFIVNKSFGAAETLAVLPIKVGATAAKFTVETASSAVDGTGRLLGYPREKDPPFEFTISYTDPDGNVAPERAARGVEAYGPFSPDAQSFATAIPSLIRILQHEWYNPQDPNHLPADSYSAFTIARALIAWASIQGVTSTYHQKRWLANMKEIHQDEWRRIGPLVLCPTGDSDAPIPRVRVRSRRQTLRSRPSSIHIVSDVVLPNRGGEILTAEIGQRSNRSSFYDHHRISQASFSGASFMLSDSASSSHEAEVPSSTVPYPVLRHALKRFSRMVLGGYGGAGMILFGVPLPSLAKAGNITAGFNESGDRFRVGYTAPTEKEVIITKGDATLPTTSSHQLQPTFNLDFNIPSPLQTHAASKGASSSSYFTVPKDSIPFPTKSKATWDERTALEQVVQQAEQDDESEDDDGSAWDMLEPPSPEHEAFHQNPSTLPKEPSRWDIFMGRHDKEIIEALAAGSVAVSPVNSTINLPGLAPGTSKGRPSLEAPKGPPPTSVSGGTGAIPRFWVLTDHNRAQIVLVLRGTMTLHEVAIDLACDMIPFEPAKKEPGSGISTPDGQSTTADEAYMVHQGMYSLAKLMGGLGRPVQEAVAHALGQNEGYELVLCGHSLGAGVCSILGLMWADPETRMTVPSSGLPSGRPISVYCFAPPCVMSPALSRLAKSFIWSFIYSHDAITRLSLGAARDLKRATSWLCYGSRQGSDESPSNIIRRAFFYKRNIPLISHDDKAEYDWFLSLRKTLEANMHYADLFPPGRVIWAVRDSSFDTSLRKNERSEATSGDLLRVFEIENVEKVFDQIIFAKDMVSSHFVQNYDRILHNSL